MTGTGRERVLWLPGVGGPNPGLVNASLSGKVDVTWVYDPAELFDHERDAGAMRASGGTVIAVGCDEEMLDAAVAAHAQAPVQAIVTMSESRLPIAARIAEKLGLRFNSVGCVTRLTDKVSQRTALRDGGVPVPRFSVVAEAADLARAAATVGFPAVLKPARGGGSMLTFPVSNIDDLRRAWASATAAFADEPTRSTSLLHQGPGLRMLAESLIRGGGGWFSDPRYGDYVSVDTAVFDGSFTHLVTADKLPLAEGFREMGQVAPSSLAPEALASVHAMTEAALTALGVTHGMCHTELKLTADGPRIIEVNGRPGGGTAGTLAAMSGYDLIWQLTGQALGHGPAEPVREGRAAGFLTPCLPAGLAGQRLRVSWREDFSTVPGFREFYDLGVTRFDLALGGGGAAIAYVEGASAQDILGLAERLRASLVIERDS
jgi:biotin carboxylase